MSGDQAREVAAGYKQWLFSDPRHESQDFRWRKAADALEHFLAESEAAARNCKVFASRIAHQANGREIERLNIAPSA
jgi:hypothetical protein